MASTSQKDLFSSVIINIKNYTGDDPLRPWIQGIRKIHQSLPPHVLHEKLPRFLQKCAQTFESDRRYRNDSRYLSVWIQLMDYVDDAKKLLKKMKNEQIGVKRAKFYIAYALYYEKKKRFKDAEKMYHLGAHNLAKPVEELEKSYFQFIQRKKLLRIKKEKRAKVESKPSTSGTSSGDSSQKISDPKDHQDAEISSQTYRAEENSSRAVDKNLNRSHASPVKDLDTSNRFYKDDPGLTFDGPLDPTISTKDATNTISSMFKVAQELETIPRGLKQVKPKPYKHQSSIEVLADEEIKEPGHVNHIFANPETSGSPKKTENTGMQKPFVCAFKMVADDDAESEDGDDNGDSDNDDDDDDDDEDDEVRTKSCDVRLNEDTVIRRLKEDTVIRKIVGSTVFDEPKFENACHHGLVDPTVNLKQAMDDINGMFGKPLNFVRTGKPKKEDKRFGSKPDDRNQAFFILADEDSEKDAKPQAPPQVSRSSRVFGEPKVENACHHGLVDPTVNPKQAMDDINGMFGKPLNFVRTGKPKKEDKRFGRKLDDSNRAFFILADEDSEKDVKPQAPPQVSRSSMGEGDFFEPTIFTKEAMDEINDLFGKPLDF